MRVLFVLPGLHRYDRGAEIAFISIASELARAGDTVTLMGSGPARESAPYRFLHIGSIPRERFESLPSIPCLRDETAYEELTFVPGLLRHYRPEDWDVTIGCSFPFTNWVLRRPVVRGVRPPHVFVTENGDWPAFATKSEYRFFGCEGLVCTNPEFYERNKNRWRCCTIPNGVDCDRFRLSGPHREQFGLPANRPIILMVSALSPSKRVEVGIESVAKLPDAHLVVAGDGPLRQLIDELAARLLPGRFTRLSLTPDRMPALYQSADVFLHLSKQESFGNVYVEAMACGLPVVAHDLPRLRWIVGKRENLVDTSDTAKVAQAIELAQRMPITERQLRADSAARFHGRALANSIANS